LKENETLSCRLASDRKAVINKDSIFLQSNPWISEVPSAVRDIAYENFKIALTTNLEKVKNKKIKKFQMSFRAKHSDSDTIVIQRRNWGKGVFKQFLNIRSEMKIPRSLSQQGKITRNRDGKYYLHVSKTTSDIQNIEKPVNKIVACDPGVRTFGTYFDSDGYVFEWGNADITKIIKKCITIDKIKSQIAKKQGTSRHRRRQRIFINKMRTNIQSNLKDFHHKQAKWLVENYNLILMPVLDTKRMGRGTNLNKSTKREMFAWNHYKFREKLKQKAELCDWVVLRMDVTEDYTSKTCSSCGVINNFLGKSKTFVCPKCNQILDRDINASKNILTKFICEKSCMSTTACGGGIVKCPSTQLVCQGQI